MNRRREVKLNNRDINVYNNNNGENATAASKVVAPPAAIKRPAENSLKNISNIPSEFKKEKVDHGCAKKEATHNESQEIVSV
jgi:hypothetical protein